MPWPKDGVKVLTARNVNKGFLRKNDNCRSLLGWLDHWFGYPSKEFWIVEEIAHQITGCPYLSDWSDDPNRPKAEIARTINKINATAGYVVDNPEAKNIA